MKPYTTPVLEVTLNIPVETVKTIKFLFKEERDPQSRTLLKKKYPSDVRCENGIYKISITQEETALFPAGKYFYLDTLITDQTGRIPQTPIISLLMSDTLFTYEEAVEE